MGGGVGSVNMQKRKRWTSADLAIWLGENGRRCQWAAVQKEGMLIHGQSSYILPQGVVAYKALTKNGRVQIAA